MVAAQFDLKAVTKLILNSAAYQQSSLPAERGDPEAVARATEWFACYPVRRLDAEVLIDAVNTLAGTGELYSSPIPEPFTFLPETQRTVQLADGSITSPFLEMFGRPARDSGREAERVNQPSEAQVRYLLNASEVQRKIANSPVLAGIGRDHAGNPGAVIQAVYVQILSRPPTPAELAALQGHFLGRKGNNPKAGLEDLAWALLNSKEFLYRH